MLSNILTVLIAVAGILIMLGIGYFFAQVMINTTKGPKNNRWK